MSEKAARVYKTRQRDEILNYIKKSGRCVTAEEIAAALASSPRHVSKPTVYRSLERFTESGEIFRFSADTGESATYMFNGESATPHLHVKCTECRSTVCMDCEFITELEEHFKRLHGFSLSPSRSVLYGVCTQCQIAAKTR